MSQAEVERFLGRLMTDADFRIMATHSLQRVCYREGIVLSAEEMTILGTIDFSKLQQAAKALDDSIRRK